MSGMTVEAIDAMDGAVDEAAPVAPAAEATTPAEETPPEETLPAEDTPGADADEPAAAEVAEPSAFDQMKAYLRAQRMENAELRSKLEMLETTVSKRAAEAPAADEAGKDYRILYDENGNEVKIPLQQQDPAKADAAVTPRFIELKNELTEISTKKGDILETLYEVMAENPKYPDAAEVLQKSYFDDLFEAIATARAREMNIPYEEALLETQVAVWKLPNPYKYMYETIKKYHQHFTQKPPAAPAPAAKPKVPQAVPSSLADIGSGTPDSGAGWTAAKLDAMDEIELNKVPQDIIDKWLRNELQ